MMNKNILKTNSFKFIQFAKWMTLVSALAIISLVFTMASMNEVTIMQLINEDIGYNIVFMVGMINVLSFFQISRICKNLKSKGDISKSILSLMVILLVQMFVFNYVCVILIIISLYKYVDWSNFKIKNEFKELRANKRVNEIYLSLTMFTLCISILYTTLFSIY